MSRSIQANQRKKTSKSGISDVPADDRIIRNFFFHKKGSNNFKVSPSIFHQVDKRYHICYYVNLDRLLSFKATKAIFKVRNSTRSHNLSLPFIELHKLAPEVRIKQIGMREDLLSIIRHTSSDHFSEGL